jgi:hypothetical protein
LDLSSFPICPFSIPGNKPGYSAALGSAGLGALEGWAEHISAGNYPGLTFFEYF